MLFGTCGIPSMVSSMPSGALPSLDKRNRRSAGLSSWLSPPSSPAPPSTMRSDTLVSLKTPRRRQSDFGRCEGNPRTGALGHSEKAEVEASIALSKAHRIRRPFIGVSCASLWTVGRMRLVAARLSFSTSDSGERQHKLRT